MQQKSQKTKQQNPLEKEQSGGKSPHDAMAASSSGHNEEEPDIDSIRLSENVIAAVARKYTLEVDGVLRFAPGSIVSGLAEMIGRKSQESSVVVSLDGEEVHISLNLILRFGVKIPEVAGAVQEIVREKVQELTGKLVTGVRVTVHDLEDETEEKEESAEKPSAE